MELIRRRGRGRGGLSSVYGFIMIYLLVMASLEAISSTLSANAAAEEAAQQAGQVDQTRSLEHLRVSVAQGGNVTVTNDGLVPSQLSFLLAQGPGGSREVPAQASLPVGSSIVLNAGAASTVAVVTSLGNVFESSQASVVPVNGTKTIGGDIGGPDVDAQLYQNPADPARFFMATGPSATEYSAITGTPLWSFDAGQGEVTDVLPLSTGQVYVSDGYFGDQFTANLYELSSAGSSLGDYSMRLFMLWTTVEVEYNNGGLPPWPSGSQPVEKGEDSLYAYYDGWFLSSAGASSTTVPGDSYELVASDGSQFYLMTLYANPGGWGCSYPEGSFATLYAYSADSSGVTDVWRSSVFLNVCNLYPNEPISGTAGSGVVAVLLAQNYFSDLNYYGGPYSGANPILLVLASSTGQVYRSGALDDNGYTSIATDGSEVYLALPATEQVEAVSATQTGPGTLYDVGIPGATLEWADNSLFVISPSQVRVYSASMNLEDSIDFSPLTFYSLSNSKSMESQMVSPSFLVLNSTSYVALLRNSTGYGTLVSGSYSP